MEYRVLGSLDVRNGEDSVALGGPKQRALLALLLLNANRAVSRDRLIDDLWGDEPPETAVQSVHVYVSRLRKLLPPETLVTEPIGYVLQVGPDELDLSRFEHQVADARASLEAGDAERGSRVLHEALELWRGPALAEFAFEPFARSEIARLEELRVAALEDRIEADLALGRHADVIGELEALIATHPHGERPREQLMVALYRSGRQAEALEAYQAARERLDELGLEPGERLRKLEKAILTHDAALKPPPKTVPKHAPTNLPVPATSLIGRKKQLADLTAVLSNVGTRLVTLTGAAGSGKTRLALQVAYELLDDFPHGAFFVGLETVRDPAFVVPAIAKSLGVEAAPGEDFELALHERLAERRLLIVLDNFEQVLDAAPIVARLLTKSAAFLVTSRAPLHVAAEREYPVPPLTLPEARELFVERARGVVPAFEPSPAVAEVCRRLDCLPLAIELAAARTKILSPAAILPRLDRRLSLLVGGPIDLPTRQQTLRAALDWSYELLTKPERRLFARLAVFAGGFDVAAAEEVCDAEIDMLQLLIDSSLVRRTGEWFSLLEAVREYACERLAADSEADAVRVRHARYFANTGETVVRLLQRAEGGQVMQQWLIANAVNIEVANTVLKATDLREEELRSVEPLAAAHLNSGRAQQALETLDEYLEAVDLSESQRCRLEALAAWTAATDGHRGRARELAAAAVSRARRVGDPMCEIWALNATGLIASETGDFSAADEAERQAEAVARAHMPQHVPMLLSNQALIALERNEFASARALLDEALELTGGNGAGIWVNLALSYLLEGRPTEAEPWLRRTLRYHHEIGAKAALVYALNGYMAFHAGRQPERAARLSGALESLRAELRIGLQHLELRLATQTREVLASRLGDRFYELEAAGAEMELDDVVALALES